jgi:hypothetical protein
MHGIDVGIGANDDIADNDLDRSTSCLPYSRLSIRNLQRALLRLQSFTPPGKQLRRMDANPAGDSRYARAGLQGLRNDLSLETIRPATPNLPRRTLETLGNRLDHMERFSLRHRRRHRTSHRRFHHRLPIQNKSPITPDAVALALTDYLAIYNEKRPHQGRNMNGRRPARAFVEGLPKSNQQKGAKSSKSMPEKQAA